MMKAGIIIRKREVGNSCFEQNSIHSFSLRKERVIKLRTLINKIIRNRLYTTSMHIYNLKIRFYIEYAYSRISRH